MKWDSENYVTFFMKLNQNYILSKNFLKGLLMKKIISSSIKKIGEKFLIKEIE